MINSGSPLGGHILKVLVPVLLSCFCVVGTALVSDTGNSLFNDCVESTTKGCFSHYLQLHWGLMIALWGSMLILSSLLPAIVNQHMPLLLVWTAWISLRSDFQLGRAEDPDGLFEDSHPLKEGWILGVLLLFASLSLLIRRRAAAMILCLAEVVFLATIPKNGEMKIALMTLQVVYYCALYFLSLLLMPARPESTYILNSVMGSVWVLWTTDMLHLTIAVLFYIGLCLLLFAVQYEHTQVWVNFNRSTASVRPAHRDDEESPIKAD